MKKEVAQKAAHWWADQLRKPAKLDNGDNSASKGGMALVLAMILQASEKGHITAEQINNFEEILTAKLEEMRDEFFCFGVDYHPDPELAHSARAAGIDPGMTNFPWKTNMYIRDGKITVACGYQSTPVEI